MRLLIVLFSLALATTACGQEEENLEFGFEESIEVCTWVSELARDVMSARQSGVPMSDTLIVAKGRLEETPEVLFQVFFGVNLDNFIAQMEAEEQDEVRAEMAELLKGAGPIALEIVKDAYGRTKFGAESNRRDAVEDFENEYFSECVSTLSKSND